MAFKLLALLLTAHVVGVLVSFDRPKFNAMRGGRARWQRGIGRSDTPWQSSDDRARAGGDWRIGDAGIE